MDSPHTACTAHSGMSAQVKINLLLNAVAVILLGFLVNNTMDIKTGLVVAAERRAQTELKIVALDHRVEQLESVFYPHK